jgi:neurofibromin 1
LKVYVLIQRHIWAEIGKLDQELVAIVLDEMVKIATSSGIGTRSCDVVADTLISLASLNVRGRLLGKMRKVCLDMHSITSTDMGARLSTKILS